jgi:large-conductance mechanosensitive channel
MVFFQYGVCVKEAEAAAAVPTQTEVLLTEIRDLLAKKDM